MKHCFIVNPRAGKGRLAGQMREKVVAACEAKGVSYDVFMPESLEQSCDYIRRMAEERGDEEVIFYACGGDGTVCQTVAEVMRLPDRKGISVGVVPIGTGNDFVRVFENKEQFLSPEAQLEGRGIAIDLIRCNDAYSINMINIGFDSEVASKKEELGRKPYLPGKMGYILGLVICLIKKPGVAMRISADGGPYEHKKLLLTTLANGRFCGGGFHSNPVACLNDGQIDMMEIQNVTRCRFLTLVGSYKKGTHLCEKNKKIVRGYKAKQVHMIFDTPMHVSVDGEIRTLEEATVSLETQALKLWLPDGVLPLRESFSEQKQEASV